MTHPLSVVIELVRLPAGRCDVCKMRRVRYALVSRGSVATPGTGRCGTCAGLVLGRQSKRVREVPGQEPLEWSIPTV